MQSDEEKIEIAETLLAQGDLGSAIEVFVELAEKYEQSGDRLKAAELWRLAGESYLYSKPSKDPFSAFSRASKLLKGKKQLNTEAKLFHSSARVNSAQNHTFDAYDAVISAEKLIDSDQQPALYGVNNILFGYISFQTGDNKLAEEKLRVGRELLLGIKDFKSQLIGQLYICRYFFDRENWIQLQPAARLAARIAEQIAPQDSHFVDWFQIEVFAASADFYQKDIRSAKAHRENALKHAAKIPISTREVIGAYLKWDSLKHKLNNV